MSLMEEEASRAVAKCRADIKACGEQLHVDDDRGRVCSDDPAADVPAAGAASPDGGGGVLTTYHAPPPHRIFFALQPNEQLLSSGIGGNVDASKAPDEGEGTTTTTLRPQRLLLLHALVASLGLDKHLTFVRTQPAIPQDLLSFHTQAYVEHLRQSASLCSLLPGGPSAPLEETSLTHALSDAEVTPVGTPTAVFSVRPSVPRTVSSNSSSSVDGCGGARRGHDSRVGDGGDGMHHIDPCVVGMLREFNVDPPHMRHDSDCPLFPRLWDFVSAYTGATLACCQALVQGAADVAINWSGGMHHAGPSRASGFCYVNDIVLGIHKLLERFHRVLYVDLDVHHGDGVEHAFAYNARVCTLSIHQYGSRFFPGTGSTEDVGCGEGVGYSVNIPLPQRVGDVTYTTLLSMALSDVAAAFDPDAVVVQCGADTIVGDLIGRLCVTTHGHAACLGRVMALHRPTLVLGGGGYHVQHTARCWAIQTAVVCGRLSTLPHDIPLRDPYYEAYRAEDPWREPPLHVELHPAIDDPLPHDVEGGQMVLALSRRLGAQLQSMRRIRWLSYGGLLKEAGAALGVVVAAVPMMVRQEYGDGERSAMETDTTTPLRSPATVAAQHGGVGDAAEREKKRRRRW